MSLTESTGVDEAAILVAVVLCIGFATIPFSLAGEYLAAVALNLLGFAGSAAVLYSPRIAQLTDDPPEVPQ